MQKYCYNGPVMQFNKCYLQNWRGETIAPTEKKARTNLIYQCKRQYGLSIAAKLSLPGKLTQLN